jgi:hypothetical protein
MTMEQKQETTKGRELGGCEVDHDDAGEALILLETASEHASQ